MSSAPGPLLQVRHLHTQFATEAGLVRAVDDVSFTIDAGETLAVVGESGSGKSVTSLSIMGLVADPPGRVAGGEILFRTRAGPVVDLARLSARALRRLRGRDIAMIFQEPMTSLNPVLSVGDQIAEAARLHLGMATAAARRRALEMLELVEIPAAKRRLDEYPHQLSGGMRQRAMIAMAMALNPALLIADEPTTALDVTVQAQVLQVINRLQREFGTAVILITHDLGVIADVADEVVVMYGGMVMEQADRMTTFGAYHHPYTEGLLQSLPAYGGERARLRPIPGQPPSPINVPPGCPFAARCAYVMDRCRAEMPPLAQAGTELEHRSACWLPHDRAARETARRKVLGQSLSVTAEA